MREYRVQIDTKIRAESKYEALVAAVTLEHLLDNPMSFCVSLDEYIPEVGDLFMWVDSGSASGDFFVGPAICTNRSVMVNGTAAISGEYTAAMGSSAGQTGLWPLDGTWIFKEAE